MRRRAPAEQVRPDDVEEVPDRVLWAGRQSRVMAELSAMTDTPGEPSPTYFQVRRRQLDDAERWCAARGLSASMTFRGCAEPSPEEVAAGRTRGAGAHYRRRVQRGAERR